jgi:hypothetical protein
MNPPENNKAKPAERQAIHGTEHASQQPFVVKAVPVAPNTERMTRTQHDSTLPFTQHTTAQPFVTTPEPVIPPAKITQHDTGQPFVPSAPAPTAPEPPKK